MENTAINTAMNKARAQMVESLNRSVALANAKVKPLYLEHCGILAGHHLEHHYVTLSDVQTRANGALVIPNEFAYPQHIIYPVAAGTDMLLNRRGMDALLVWVFRRETDVEAAEAILSAEKMMTDTGNKGCIRVRFADTAQRNEFCAASRLMFTFTNKPDQDLNAKGSVDLVTGSAGVYPNYVA